MIKNAEHLFGVFFICNFIRFIILKMFPENLNIKMNERKAQDAFRKLGVNHPNRIDFSSNDYLGFAQSETIFNQTHQLLVDKNLLINGATGSRLISGNFDLYTETEKHIAEFHQSETALIYNSGYDANLGFFSAVLQKGDVVLYDEYIHASIRDGIRLSLAKAYKFEHNNSSDLTQKIIQHQKQNTGNIYVVTESVFSMDGDTPELVEMSKICTDNQAYLIVDEAHALGVFGNQGCGLVQELELQESVFARIVTFGKGLGCHGAAVLGSQQLTDYLINFSRSFIYTTGLSPHSVASIQTAYQVLQCNAFITAQNQLQNIIYHFNTEVKRLNLESIFISSHSAIHCAVISGNERVKKIAAEMQKQNFEVKPILSPTVPLGQERLRICLHAYNTPQEVTQVLELLRKFVSAILN